MGIRRARGVAEAAKNIDRSHVYVDHIAPIDDGQLVFGETDIAAGIRIIKVPASTSDNYRR